MKAKVILFRHSGKYYTEEEWEVPTSAAEAAQVAIERRLIFFPGDMTVPYVMRYSKDFRRIDDGKVLVVSQEPWGYPHLL
jgi:poly-beta-hydroxyalkanoate depolymerase